MHVTGVFEMTSEQGLECQGSSRQRVLTDGERALYKVKGIGTIRGETS